MGEVEVDHNAAKEEETKPLIGSEGEEEVEKENNHDESEAAMMHREEPDIQPYVGRSSFGNDAYSNDDRSSSVEQQYQEQERRRRVVIGEPVRRAQWNSGLFDCLGTNDEFCSSDFEVCLLGTCAPCVLYGSNDERLGATPGGFVNHCLTYAGLYLLGYSLYGWNWMAPWLSFHSRIEVRERFNLEGDCESLSKACCGCCGSIVEDEERREQCEAACDFLTHVFCHTCALCQEGREVRRRIPHPGFQNQSLLIMVPPTEQLMEHSRTIMEHNRI